MKPHVICHMCTTIDGRILSNRWKPFGKHNGSTNLFETTAASFGIGAWIVGTTTMKEFADGGSMALPKKVGKIGRIDHVVNTGTKKFAIGVDTKGVLRWKTNEVTGDHAIMLITERVSTAYLAHLQAADVSYLFCGEREVDLKVALDKLYRLFGIRKLMAQGGGKFNGSMLKEGLIDEVSQLIVPLADGGMGVSTMFDIPGEAPAKVSAVLKTKSLKKMPGGVYWLRYVVK